MIKNNRPFIRDAIIGGTGFVGSNLALQVEDAEVFNSKTIGEIAGKSFGTLYCAAAPGSMFVANKFPDLDEARIYALIKSLEQVRAERFVLISTIAVLEDFGFEHDEYTQSYQTTLPYGQNRRRLEEAVEAHFETSLIVRLPALFGRGLTKNFIFDLLNPIPSMLTADTLGKALKMPQVGELVGKLYAWVPELDMYKIDRIALSKLPEKFALESAFAAVGFTAIGFHNCDTTYQFYNLKNLRADCDRAFEAGLSCIHLSPEPTSTAHVYEALTGGPMPETVARLHSEDLRTRHAAVWGREDGYIASADTVLAELAAFFNAERAGN